MPEPTNFGKLSAAAATTAAGGCVARADRSRRPCGGWGAPAAVHGRLTAENKTFVLFEKLFDFSRWRSGRRFRRIRFRWNFLSTKY
jgi:hypothetical protein